MRIHSKGFTLVEVIASVSIIATIMAIVVFQGRQLVENMAVSAAAQEISIAIREAQSYGVSVKATSGGQFTYAYGVSFDISSNNYIYIFSDTNANGIYDGTTACTSECIKMIQIQGGIRISQLCGTTGGSVSCPGSMGRVNISFLRPNPDPIIKLTNSVGNPIGGTWSSGRVSITNNNNKIKMISMDSVGKLSIQ